ncbi:L,D-transpeptidase [Microbaculum marinum]|uniref:L,D-transpeptidase n=1 Tax=Microbaculum marinum TaxID=1764581 RepID=A0AAW9RCT1_9HYPH
MDSGRLSRRSFLSGSAAGLGVLGLGAVGLGGCASSGGMTRAQAALAYAALPDEPYPVPAVDLDKVDPKFYRRTVPYETSEAPGTIIIDPSSYYVYFVEGDGTATRYGANVPKPEFLWDGTAYVGRKAEWPIWTPTRDQIGRDPELKKYAGGMPPGLENPLGARVLYLYQDGRYTLCTIYSTVYPQTIGQGVSSGCVGLLTQDMLHLYARAPVDTNVVILPA